MTRAATRAPRTLYAQCEQHANDEHSRRLAELAGLAPALRRLDELMPVLKKHGLELTPDRISLWKWNQGNRWVNTLRITPTWWTGNGQDTAKWLVALRECRCEPIQVTGTPEHPAARLRSGHTYITIDVTVEDAAALRSELAARNLQEAS